MTADGAAAEYVVAPAEVLAPAPASIPLADAAALPMVGLTAWQALFDDAGAEAGQRVLINGAGGAVGGYAVQLAKRAGAHVIATASPRSSERVCRRGRRRGHRPHHHRGPRRPWPSRSTCCSTSRGSPPRSWPRWSPWSRPAASSSTRCRRSRRPPTRRAACAPSASSSAATPSSSRSWWRWSTAASCASTSPQRVPLAELPGVHAEGAAGELSGKVVVVVENS